MKYFSPALRKTFELAAGVLPLWSRIKLMVRPPTLTGPPQIFTSEYQRNLCGMLPYYSPMRIAKISAMPQGLAMLASMDRYMDGKRHNRG
ncbi:hypothetical protein [Lutimaribacter saemankumensis]|uniref:hypothetical protein n=1 Tax=Lutimaribacter saemankumensis TaxID=490829 RepID=UPI001113D081|nr:hypothetical protein [Lutimaribacter saemankumensis]